MHTEQTALFPNLSRKILSYTEKDYPQNPPLTKNERHKIAIEIRRRSYNLAPKQASSLYAEADRFCQCGDQYKLFECPNDKMQFTVPITCNSRICERCGRRYGRKIKNSLNQVLKPYFHKPIKGFGVFLLTLTVQTDRYDDMPSREDIQRFYKESSNFLRLFYGKYSCKMTSSGKVIEDQTRMKFENGKIGGKKIRRKPKIKPNGKEEWRRWRGAGYIAAIEIGKGNNLHCHAVIFAPYISQKKLSATWLKLTGDSFIVDIRSIKKVQTAVGYILKYIIKPPQTDSYVELVDYIETIKGTRRIRTGGVFYNRIKKEESEKLDFTCPHCNGYIEMINIIDIDEAKKTPLLYKLLIKRKERGSPLPYYQENVTTADQRYISAMREKFENSITWLN